MPAFLHYSEGGSGGKCISFASFTCECAVAYQKNLLNRFVLFVARPVKPSDNAMPVETFYGADNFQHLCGYNYGRLKYARDFFKMALQDELKDALLKPKYTHNTRAKLRVLPTLMHIDSQAAYLVRQPVLPGETKSDVVCANTTAMIGYVNTGALLVPRTALEISQMHEGRQNISLVFKTEPNQREYTLITKNRPPKDPRKANERMVAIRRSLKLYRERVGSLKMESVMAQLG